jgi:hypothetical protein
MKPVTSFRAATIFAVSVVSTTPAAAGQTLPEMIRANGGVGGNSIGLDAPVSSMRDVVSGSDLVFRGGVVEARTLLSADESMVETEYVIRPIEAFKDERRQAVKTPGVVATIVVRRAGGRLVTEDGLRLWTSASIFPEAECFTVGEEVVVMLTYRPDVQAYSFTHGAFGAFRIRDGMVTPMTKEVAQRRKDVPTSIAAFLSEVQRHSVK